VTVLQTYHASRVTQYVYGTGDSPLASYGVEGWTYLSGRDGLNSVRQETDAQGNVSAARSFDPYGVPMEGEGGNPFGFTGEQTDERGLVFLRARMYQPTLGIFLSRDPWIGYDPEPLSHHQYLYAMADPINLSDSSGLRAEGLGYFAVCFNLAVGSQVIPGDAGYFNKTAQEAVNICKAAFNKDNWDPIAYMHQRSDELPKTAYELMEWFVTEWRGKYKSDRLFFGADEPLAQEVSRSPLISEVRRKYYTEGELGTPRPALYDFGFLEFVASGSPLSISSFMGSFWYQVRTVRTNGEERVGFRIDNDTTLASGSHFAFRFPDEYTDNVEDLIAPSKRPELANRPLSEIVRDTERYKLISILRSRTKEETKGSQGGGNLYQTYMWTEPQDCLWAYWVAPYMMPDIQVWSNFRSYTSDPVGWPAK
jgi:RHS repeat-associated protein